MMTKEKCSKLYKDFSWKSHYCRYCEEWIRGEACDNKKNRCGFNANRHKAFCKIADINEILRRIKLEESFDYNSLRR